MHVSPDLKVGADFQRRAGEILGDPPSESMWFCTESSEGSREPFLMCPDALKSTWFDLSAHSFFFSKHFFFRDILATWRFFRPCLNHIRKVKVFPKNLKNRKVKFFSMKNPSFQNLIQKSLRNALKLVRVDFDRNRSSYGREKDPDMKFLKFSVCLSIYLGKSHFPK